MLISLRITKAKAHLLLLILNSIAFQLNATPTPTVKVILNNCTKKEILNLTNSDTIKELSLKACLVFDLKNAFLIRFKNLKLLECIDCNLTWLEENTLDGLQQLHTLTLARNNISEVKQWSYQEMNALYSLDLQRNAIKDLTLKSFYLYPNLQSLNLAENFITHIGNGTFHRMSYLQYLNLGYNHLQTIEKNAFEGLHRLTFLAVNNNVIHNVSSSSLDSIKHLRSLRLDGNQLEELDFFPESNIALLEHLNISHNIINLLGTSFSKNNKLVSLDVSHNQLINVTSSDFAVLNSLESLNISYNIITNIESGSFNMLSNLLELKLASNLLRTLPVNLLKATSFLQYVDFSINLLTNIDEKLLSQLPHLTTLDISKNKLNNCNFVKQLVPTLNRLELKLDLSDNFMYKVNVSTLTDFKQVDLAGNRWNCEWLIQEILRVPQTVHFGRDYSVSTFWSIELLHTKGINCFDEIHNRTLVIIDTAQILEQRQEYGPEISQPPSPPSLSWPKIRIDKFDSRSVIIWMLIAIAIAFSALRVARQLIDRKERKTLITQLKEKQETQLLGENLMKKEYST